MFVVRTRVGMYLIPHELFTEKILSTYIGLENLNNIFRLVFMDEILDYYI